MGERRRGHAVLLRRAAPRRRRPARLPRPRAGGRARAAGARATPGAPAGHRRRRRGRGGSSTTRSAAGHEGVVVKNLAAAYDAGRRGSAWVKVKPVHTLDLVVLAVEWGSGRREGWLSNIHLGARDPDVRRVRDAGQDVQGHDRRDARLADRAVHRAGDSPDRRVGVRRARAARAGRRDRLRRRPALDPLPRRHRAALRPGGALPRRQDRRRGRHDRHGAAATAPRTVADRGSSVTTCAIGRCTGRYDDRMASTAPRRPTDGGSRRRRARAGAPRAGDPRRDPCAVRRARRPGRADRGHRAGGRDQPGDRLPALHRQGGALRAHPGRLPRRARAPP